MWGLELITAQQHDPQLPECKMQQYTYVAGCTNEKKKRNRKNEQNRLFVVRSIILDYLTCEQVDFRIFK